MSEGQGPGRASFNTPPPSDKPRELDPIERRLRGLEMRLRMTEDARINMRRYFEERINALETVLQALLKEKDG